MKPEAKERLKELVERCIVRGEVKLASGAVSDFYVDGRLVTLSPEGSLLIGQAILATARELKADAIGGPTTGACPMVTAAGVLAAQEDAPLALFYVRSAPKGHGMQKAIEGPALAAGARVLMVEDVLTSGGSLVRAIERVREETAAVVVGAFGLVDREAGAREALERAGVPFVALFTRSELSG